MKPVARLRLGHPRFGGDGPAMIDWRLGPEFRSNRIEPGHMAEWVWLLRRYARSAPERAEEADVSGIADVYRDIHKGLRSILFSTVSDAGRLDPSDRAYGSLWGTRPDWINYGAVGFGRVVSPEAWLSTWSALSSNATVASLNQRSAECSQLSCQRLSSLT